MRYGACVRGRFLSRPNRFIALVDVDGVETVCHVKNTGRCRELLVPGATVILERAVNPNRKTKFDLIAVYKGDRLVNMDSQCPNRVAAELLPKLFPQAELIQPEVVYGHSRFDFYIRTPQRRCYVEVKGVTLEDGGVARFPDAPTQRGVKHLTELRLCAAEGCGAYLLFLVQMKGVSVVRPNDETDPEFGAALRRAAEGGVQVLAYDCVVTEDSVTASSPIPVEF